jgi:non-heme chloroperoxidase
MMPIVRTEGAKFVLPQGTSTKHYERTPMTPASKLLAASSLAIAAAASAAPGAHGTGPQPASLPYIAANDGTPLYYKDWGPRNGPVVAFSHGWPLSSDSWEAQMLFLAERGFRVIAHDRRGHGRSGQPWANNTMDQYADDLAAVLGTLNVRGVTLASRRVAARSRATSAGTAPAGSASWSS